MLHRFFLYTRVSAAVLTCGVSFIASYHALADESEVNNLIAVLLIEEKDNTQSASKNDQKQSPKPNSKKKEPLSHSSNLTTEGFIDAILEPHRIHDSTKVEKALQSGTNDLLPKLNIPESELLEVNSKFPKDFVGKYVYGDIILTSIQINYEEPYITFRSKNFRGFFLNITDRNIARKFMRYKRGDRFYIPKTFPLKIQTKVFTGVYHLELPN
jgi:hypothetical protein